MTWTRIRKLLKGAKDPFIYLYEERLWFIGATLDSTNPQTLNNLVEQKYMRRVSLIKEERERKKLEDSSVLETEVDESLHTVNTEKMQKQINIKVIVFLKFIELYGMPARSS